MSAHSDDWTAGAVVLIAGAAGARGLSVGGAESVTAGRIATALASGPGASQWFCGAVVAWSPQLKHGLLGVPDVPIVSAECAAALADGARQVLGCDVAYATTGVGGPDDEDGQPAGTVWLAVSGLGETQVRLHHFDGAPKDVVDQAETAALALLVQQLQAPPHTPDIAV